MASAPSFRAPRPGAPTLDQIRARFLDFFGARGHALPGSAPLAPKDDPTLLFVNAGMAPFKNYFTGAETPSFLRAATAQKCVRAGGKHNDLDNVGYTARHHTFFEMLGNFSFGDYFKEDAIRFAWELVTKDFELPQDRLLVTVFSEDEEAAGLWRKIAGLPDAKIIRISTSDNFWTMGDTGPCGPCSEIFFDHGAEIFGGPPGSPDADGDRFVEIWNLVFMQFEQHADGRREPLPKPCIDTGAGLERVAAVLQGVHSNYEIDLFRTLIEASVELTGAAAVGAAASSHRVIADHLRASCFLLADGVSPGPEGRGYVLRRIMRRAMRHAHILGAREPLMHRLAPTLIAQMGAAYPELVRASALITAELEQEESRFRRTLERGLALLEEEARALPEGGALSGDTAFKLYDTFGFPLDLTQDILRSRGQSVDADGFERAMSRQREKGRDAWVGSGDKAADQLWFALRERVGDSRFTGYEVESGGGRLAAIVSAGQEQPRLEAGSTAELVFDSTPFYAESGGQNGDTGSILFENGAVFLVEDVQKRAGGLHGHVGRLEAGVITPGDSALLSIDAERRRRIRANHSAVHLLHAALRRVLGPHVSQKGQLVDGERLRFDFAHGAPVTPEQIERIEHEVNAVVRQNMEAATADMTPADAVAAGAIGLFGEKYGERVRVLSLGRRLEGEAGVYSMELCGGTHVARTGDIAVFTIVSESGVAGGVRRIEAATGQAALAHLRAQAGLAKAVASHLKTPVEDLLERVASLAEERRRLERELAEAKKRLALGGGVGAAQREPELLAGVKLLAQRLEGVPAKDLRALVDEAKRTLGSGVAVMLGVEEGKAALAVGVTGDLTPRLSAVELVKAGVAALGGQGGGGRADMAQGGGPKAEAAEQALMAVRAAVEAALAL
jgi:alanyl-tRNA synthetase